MAITAVNEYTLPALGKVSEKTANVDKKNQAQELQDNFLTLLIAQLRNQDPTDPLKNHELTSQLAQINTIQSIEKLNTHVGNIKRQIDNNQPLQASTLIGHGVMIPGNRVLTNNQDGRVVSTPFGIELERAAEKVNLTLTNKEGEVVRQINIGRLKAGVHSFNWDGMSQLGTLVPDGAYNIQINALNSSGEAIPATPLMFAKVNGIIRDVKNGSELDLGPLGTTQLEQVRQIL